MKKIIYITLSLLISTQAFADSNKHKEIKSLIKSLFPVVSKSKSSALKTKGCNIDKKKWGMLLVTLGPLEQEFKFARKCDLEGTFTAYVNKDFALELRMKDLQNFSYFKSKAKIQLDFKKKPTLSFILKNSKITGNKKVEFDFNYAVEIDPLAQDIVQKHLGGELYVKRINGKVIKERIKIDQESFE